LVHLVLGGALVFCMMSSWGASVFGRRLCLSYKMKKKEKKERKKKTEKEEADANLAGIPGNQCNAAEPRLHDNTRTHLSTRLHSNCFEDEDLQPSDLRTNNHTPIYMLNLSD
ncbi:hypothetical protein JOQ06_025691, partial [Pogonophryne albipinna]